MDVQDVRLLLESASHCLQVPLSVDVQPETVQIRGIYLQNLEPSRVRYTLTATQLNTSTFKLLKSVSFLMSCPMAVSQCYARSPKSTDRDIHDEESQSSSLLGPP